MNNQRKRGIAESEDRALIEQYEAAIKEAQEIVNSPSATELAIELAEKTIERFEKKIIRLKVA